MMYRERVCGECGQKKLVPYDESEYKTPYERMDFERQWDRRVVEGRDSNPRP